MEGIHCCINTARDESLNEERCLVKEHGELRTLCFIEGIKHVVNRISSPLRPPYPDPYSDECITFHMVNNRSDSLMPCISTASLNLESPEIEIEIIVDDNEVMERDAEVVRGLFNCFPAPVHIGERLHQDDLFIADSSSPEDGAELSLF